MTTRRRLHPAAPSARFTPFLLALLAAACGSPPSEDGGARDQAIKFGGTLAPIGTANGLSSVAPGPAVRAFQIKALGARCVDAGGQAFWQVGEPIIICGCNGTVAQQIGVAEVSDGSHDITLQVGGLCVGVHGGVVALGGALELQACNGSPAQRFAFDGDALMMGLQASGHATRDYVIEPNAQSSAQHTPLVVATRIAAEAEYFTMSAIDKSGADPTSGFFHITNEAALDDLLQHGWGTVAVVDESQPLVLTSSVTKTLPAGFTLRGYRKYMDNGPQILATGTASPTFDIPQGSDHVRITGLRLQGPTSTTATLPPSDGIVVFDGYPTLQPALIDHNDISGYPGAAVSAVSTDDGDTPYSCGIGRPMPRPTPVQILRNFLHNNESSEGYGAASGQGSFLLIEGNTFTMNRHAIAADAHTLTGYVAHYNLTTFDVPAYGKVSQLHEQDFDMHGSGTGSPDWNYGWSGDYFDVGWNTFLGTDRTNIDDRGTPCRPTIAHDNVFMSSGMSNDVNDEKSAVVSLATNPNSNFAIAPSNVFGAANPTSDLGVGDFDGDGVDDVFLGTGNAWFYSSGGVSEWRWMNAANEHASALLFGDFDADGRTDVMAVHGTSWDVSWGGASVWQTINSSSALASSLRIGDFNGDGYADVFYADGAAWWVSDKGTGAPAFMATSSEASSKLRFGDFNRDGKTDVFGISGGEWSYVQGGGGSTWLPLRPALTSSVDGLVVGDFDGDGYADIASMPASTWQFSSAGKSGWNGMASEMPAVAVLGKFNGDKTTDAIVWGSGSNSAHFQLAPSCVAPNGLSGLATQWSNQEMR